MANKATERITIIITKTSARQRHSHDPGRAPDSPGSSGRVPESSDGPLQVTRSRSMTSGGARSSGSEEASQRATSAVSQEQWNGLPDSLSTTPAARPCKHHHELYQGRRQVKKCGVDSHGEHVEREPITGLGQTSQRGPRADQLVRRSRGKAPMKLKPFSFWCPTEAANLLHSPYFANSLNPNPNPSPPE